MNAVARLALQLSLILAVVASALPCGAAPPPDLQAAGAASAVQDTAPAAGGAQASDAQCAAAHGQSVCAVTYDPAELDPQISPVQVGPPGKGGGWGRHYACFPQEPGRWNGQLLVHLVGTWGDPATAHGLAELACSLGFAAVVPMYKNTMDARSACGADSACYEGMRREVLYGGDSAPDPIQVDAANSFVHRLDTLLLRLAARERRFAPWTALRERVMARDLSAVAVSGHSQGAGHALLLARDHEVARVILLGGPTDRLRSGSPEHAAVDWVTTWAVGSKTPAARLWGYAHSDDKIVVPAQLTANYDALGVGATSCPFSEAGDYPLACRRIRATAAGCQPVPAHVSVILRRFGEAQDACKVDGQELSNAATWQFLLIAPP